MSKLILSIALSAAIVSTQAGAHAHASGRAATAQPDLTREQARQRADQLFATFDLNHDGVVTRAEANQVATQLMTERAASGTDVAPGLGGHTARFLEQTFAGAQSVTQRQFEQAMLAHFDQMDTNHDGILTAHERLQGRSDRSGGQ